MKGLLRVIVLLLCSLLSLGTAGETSNRAESFVPNAVDIYLPSNLSTGYCWVSNVEDRAVVELEGQFFPNSEETLGLVGEGGIQWFHIAGLKQGVTSVILYYGRPWEMEPERTLTYRLSVDEDLNILIWGIEEQ